MRRLSGGGDERGVRVTWASFEPRCRRTPLTTYNRTVVYSWRDRAGEGRADALFHALADRTRRDIIRRLTDDGLAFAIFYTKVHNRVLRPLMATNRPQAPPPVRAALRTIDAHIDARLAEARLPSAAA